MYREEFNSGLAVGESCQDDLKPPFRAIEQRPRWVESGCGAVAVGQACLLPPLSSGGALVARP